MSHDQKPNTPTSTAQPEQQNHNCLPNNGVNQNGQAQNSSKNGNSAPPSADMSHHWQTEAGANLLTGHTSGENRHNQSR
jgi:hypothetical protein